MFLIAGLGNPTKTYAGTRHNIGFEVLDCLADRCGISVNAKKYKALYGMGQIEGQKVLLMKPQTFMNLSGEAVSAMASYYKIQPQQMIVIYDDINLPTGQLRVRKKGSAGGHNGVKNIIERTGSSDFMRVRVGIGEKPEGWDLADYVLSKFSKTERPLMEEAIDDAASAVILMIGQGADVAMNRYNAKKKETP